MVAFPLLGSVRAGTSRVRHTAGTPRSFVLRLALEEIVEELDALFRRVEVLRLEDFEIILSCVSKVASSFSDSGSVDEVVINTGML